MTDDELRHVFEVAEDHALQSGATLSEAAMIAALPRAERHEAFLRIWTLKEAFVKATGEGIAMGLENFGFTLDEPPALAFAPASTGPVPAWRFLQFKPTATNILAVALRKRQPG